MRQSPFNRRLLFHSGGVAAFALAIAIAAILRQSACEPVRILFIGNSLTFVHDVPALLGEIAESDGRCSESRVIAAGGVSLRDHWVGGEALAAIRGGGWDFVVLQEQSKHPLFEPQETQNVTAAFIGEIRKHGAQPALYMIWAWGDDWANQPRLTRFFNDLGRTHAAIVVPVGHAWELSLRQRPDLRLHEPDQNHANQAGAYLAAATFYAELFGRTPVALENLSGLGDSDGAALQRAAWSAAGK